jgi:CelD/BcsL family acetyltransferase involved in cellulose biosynthesis
VRSEAPVLDLSPGWDAVYRSKMPSKRRNHHRRRRRQLAEQGRVEVTVARTEPALEQALEDAFSLHMLRWRGRPDGSGFATPLGRSFNHALVKSLAPLDVPRIVLLKIDGRPVAFHYYLAFAGTMFVHRIAFDPAFGQFSPGVINTLDAIEAAAAEGLTRVEFLGGAERYKLELADRLEPLCQGFGLARTLRGKAAVASRVAGIRVRIHLKRSHALRRFYFEGLAPARRFLARAP